MTISERFNHSGFGQWINGRSGRLFRLCAGIFFLTVGIVFRDHPLGVAALIWSFFPLTAAIFNVCWISLVLGGPFKSDKITQKLE